MRILNLGILAHVDAGKTTLTERLLHAAGVIDHIGRVDDGSTQTDFLPLERERGITIKSAVVNFAIGDTAVNLIDTPGHPDFIAEVERILCTLDGAVLLISAVEGVQAQTRVLMRALKRLNIPTIMFVNKIDRAGAQEEEALSEIREKLTPAVVALGDTDRLGTRTAEFSPFSFDDPRLTSELIEVLGDNDDSFLAMYTEGADVTPACLREALQRSTYATRVHPVLFGSALTGSGLAPLMNAIQTLLPPSEGDVAADLSGTIFKIERSRSGEKVSFARLFAGTLRVRDIVRYGRGHESKVIGISVFENGPVVASDRIEAGQIGRITGLPAVRIGDAIGQANTSGLEHYFVPPALETAVAPARPSEKARLHTALTQLAEQDPLINLRQDDIRGEMYVSLYGEVQKEVIEATLALEFGVEAQFRETSQIYMERPIGRGYSVEWLGKNGNPFLATVGLSIEPAPVDSGIEFRLETELVTTPLYVYKSRDLFKIAMEEHVRQTLKEGLLGWQVTDCVVTMVECGYAAPSTGARDYRLLTPLVLMASLEQAGTETCEPLNTFEVELPAESLPSVISLISRLGGVPHGSEIRGPTCVLKGEIAAGHVHELRRTVPALTHGEGIVEVSFGGYKPLHCPRPPKRPRTDLNPLNRREYLLRLAGRL